MTLTGPRQSGKTTLCRSLFPDKPYVTLEDPDTRRFAQEDPRGFLKGLEAGAIIDEIRRASQIPSYLQAMVDADPTPGRFVLTGSQQFELMSQVSQSLAGRTAVLRLLPFSLPEVARLHPVPPLAQTLLTGFYPRIHDRGLDPSRVLGDYFATYVERDLRQLAAVRDLQRFERFVRLCAGRVGQLEPHESGQRCRRVACHCSGLAGPAPDQLYRACATALVYQHVEAPREESETVLLRRRLGLLVVGLAQRRPGRARPALWEPV
ncbi:hypothetical protein GmRootV116_64150 (plasmid) [Variovorax sp. V116]